MTIDFTAMPTTLDAAHLVLAVLVLLFMVLFLRKQGSKPEDAAASAPPAAVQVEPAPPPALKEASPDAALQMLALLQQEARFIDFLQEELGGFSDAEIGAVARVVHEGGHRALNEYFSLEQIRSEEEESRITIDSGFNASEIRLTGNVVGEAPFTGTLVHRGWRVSGVRLPRLAEGHDATIIAPAEVEL
jgi:hypothetical protein